jgi:hypothetical protein
MKTKEQVQQFLTLQGKNETELKAICEGLKLPTDGNKADLINQLLVLNVPQQDSVVKPQAIPLTSRDKMQRPMEAATNAMKQWRRLIFQSKGNVREFSLLNNDGEVYSLRMKYAKCSVKTVHAILKKGWYLQLPRYRDIIELITKNPEKFSCNIVQKPGTNGNSWLMLHVEPQDDTRNQNQG